MPGYPGIFVWRSLWDRVPPFWQNSTAPRASRLRVITTITTMFAKLMPREGRFFECFTAHATQIVEGSHALVQLMSDPEHAAVHAERIDHAERNADKITHETITLLHRTFIT